MSHDVNLTTSPRAGTGSRDARRLRASGSVPVNVYGHGEANQNLSIPAHDLLAALAGQAHVFTLQIGGTSQPCLVKEVHYDTFGQDVLHVDFARVSLTEEVEVEVELELVGPAKGVTDGGQLVTHHTALWVRCLASAIPDRLSVDITGLAIGQALHAADIPLPEGVRLDEEHMEATESIVGVVPPRVEAEETAEAEGVEGAAEGAEPGEPGAVGDEAEPKSEDD
jgi:large subunit ribosomal protein L25